MMIATVIFLLCCLLSTARILSEAPRPSSLATGDIAQRSDQRFAAVKAALPQRGVVGYVGDPGIPALGDYYLAQYALAPLVLDHSPNHSLVVGNFMTSPTSRELPAGLRLVTDFGDGVMLFAAKDAR